MPTYLTPGVYVEEIPSSSKPIEGVGTAVAAFVGLAQLRRSTPALAPQGRRSTNYLSHITEWLID